MLKAKDPLRTLSEISGNFPFLAPSLTNSAADRQLEDEVEGLQHSAWGPGVRASPAQLRRAQSPHHTAPFAPCNDCKTFES